MGNCALISICCVVETWWTLYRAWELRILFGKCVFVDHHEMASLCWIQALPFFEQPWIVSLFSKINHSTHMIIWSVVIAIRGFIIFLWILFFIIVFIIILRMFPINKLILQNLDGLNDRFWAELEVKIHIWVAMLFEIIIISWVLIIIRAISVVLLILDCASVP